MLLIIPHVTGIGWQPDLNPLFRGCMQKKQEIKNVLERVRRRTKEKLDTISFLREQKEEDKEQKRELKEILRRARRRSQEKQEKLQKKQEEKEEIRDILRRVRQRTQEKQADIEELRQENQDLQEKVNRVRSEKLELQNDLRKERQQARKKLQNSSFQLVHLKHERRTLLEAQESLVLENQKLQEELKKAYMCYYTMLIILGGAVFTWLLWSQSEKQPVPHLDLPDVDEVAKADGKEGRLYIRGLYEGYIGIMEKKMETTGIIGII